MRVAGHEFDLRETDPMCSLDLQGRPGERCQRRVSHLVGVVESDVGKGDIAHVSTLNNTEFGEIQALMKWLEERNERMVAAVRAVCGA